MQPQLTTTFDPVTQLVSIDEEANNLLILDEYQAIQLYNQLGSIDFNTEHSKKQFFGQIESHSFDSNKDIP
jgi:hypothetical protein